MVPLEVAIKNIIMYNNTNMIMEDRVEQKTNSNYVPPKRDYL